MTQTMQFIDGDQVHTLGEFSQLIDALNQFHAEDTQALGDLMLTQTLDSADDNHVLVRAAWQHNRSVGIKLVTVFPDNPNQSQKIPAVQAVVVLFDGIDGTPVAIIDGTALTYRKTAADSALGSRYLCPSDAKTMLMVGAGGLAPYLIQAHLTVRPSIDTVMIWNRTSERASALARSLSSTGLKVEAVDQLESAAGSADLVCCATSSTRPLIHGAWLKPGTHVDLVGGYTPVLREADDEVFRRGSIFVDARATTVEVVGELIIPIANGVITASDVLADLYDLARKKHPGRRETEEITVFKNGGGGHLDLMTARFLLEQTKV